MTSLRLVPALAFVVALAAAPHSATAQASAASRYPVRPGILDEAEEVRLARTAAPREVSGKAAVWVLRAGGPVKVREGTNGAACMVARDLHEGSLYPICYDAEGSRTLMQHELLSLKLRAEGRSETEVKAALAAGLRAGTLKTATKPSVAYMMSAEQVLFTSPDSAGFRVGAWHPHVMIAAPGARPEDFGLASDSRHPHLSVESAGTPAAQLIVVVPAWADSASPR